MNDGPYTRAQWDRLADEQRAILQRIAANRGLDPIPDDPQDAQEPDAEIREAFNLFRPCQGCIPEDEIGDNVLLDVRHKFSAIHYVAAEMAEEELRAEGYWAESEALGLRLVIDASYEDTSHMLVVDWYPDLRPFCYYSREVNAWHFVFAQLADLADEVLRIRDMLTGRVRELVTPRHATPVRFQVEYLIRSGISNEVVAMGRAIVMAHDKPQARQRAIDWAHAHDYHCDDRIDPAVETLSVEEIDEEDQDVVNTQEAPENEEIP
jgi:hypothetical protein